MEPPLTLQTQLEQLWLKQKPFVAFCLPQSNEVQLYFQQDNTLHKTTRLNDSGFALAPFDPETPTYFIPNTLQKSFPIPKAQQQFPSEIPLAETQQEKTAFVQLIQKAVHTISSGSFKKLVVSRKIEHQTSKSPVVVFMDLLRAYNGTMVYLWSHPKGGCWLGASPEKFLKKMEEGVQTEALAGTQVYHSSKKIVWKQKEIDEQELVAEQIRQDLKPFFTSEETKEHPPRTIRAGNLVHRSSLFELPKFQQPLHLLSKALHPTPAVGGIPKVKAVEFIKKEEDYNRSFYTGYFGPVSKNEAHLFVNLRCASYESGKFRLYVGAGITSESQPEKEWEETQRKALTIAKVL